jgi:hypothetical protein
VVSHSYRWSGYGTSPIPQVLTKEHQHSWLGTRPEPAEFGSDWYVSFFYLGHALQYGETAELEWLEEFRDTAGTFGNFLTSRAAFADMDYLRFEVTGLPPGFAHRVVGGMFETPSGRLVLSGSAQDIEPDANEAYKYEVKNPVQGSHYGLRWEAIGSTM